MQMECEVLFRSWNTDIYSDTLKYKVQVWYKQINYMYGQEKSRRETEKHDLNRQTVDVNTVCYV